MLNEIDFKTDNIKKSFLGYNRQMVEEKMMLIQKDYNKLVEEMTSKTNELESVTKSLHEKENERLELEKYAQEQDITVEDLKVKVDSLYNQLEAFKQEALKNNINTSQVVPEVTPEVPENTNNKSTSSSSLNINEDDVFVGEIEEPIHKKMDESHLIGTEEDDNDDFEFV